MTVNLVVAALAVVGLAGQWLHYRPDARARLRAALIRPLVRRGHCVRRTLTALGRAARLRPYKPAHAPATRHHHYEETSR